MEYRKIFTDEYLGKIFYYCLKKTGNEQDAEDLASEISIEVLSSLARGNSPDNFGAWVWSIAKNRYARWAKSKYYSRGSETLDISEIDDVADEEKGTEEAYLQQEATETLRRELAFIRSEYRRILVAYYFEGKSVTLISKELGVPLGTVMTRLQNGRKILKEGMNMARTFGIRSYKPEEVRFINNGGISASGQPWTALEHLSYKNIFLEVYNNPKSAQELSLELGIALPYMEDDLRYLTKQTFLENIKDKYETSFSIIGGEAQRRAFEANSETVAPLTKLLEERLDFINETGEKHGNRYYGPYQTYEEAKWTLLPYSFRNLFSSVCKYRLASLPVRPDGGGWEIVGYQTVDFTLPNCVEFNISRRINECIFGEFRFKYDGMFGTLPYWLTDGEIKALSHAVKGMACEADEDEIEKLIRYGYVDADSLRPTVAVFDEKDKVAFTAAEYRKLMHLETDIKEILRDSYRKTVDIMKKEMPKKFFESPNQFNSVLGSLAINNDYICSCAVQDGFLRYDEDMKRTVGNFMLV